MTETYHLDLQGPVALRIDRETYSDLMDVSDKTAMMAFPFPFETSQDRNNPNQNPDDVKIVVQLLRITDEYLTALSKTGFDISRILSPERLEAYTESITK